MSDTDHDKFLKAHKKRMDARKSKLEKFIIYYEKIN